MKRLTSVATNLFKRGSYEPAFESLMKAYFLDPTSPHVLACEKTLMPALEMLRQRGSFSTSDLSGASGQNLQLARLLTQLASKPSSAAEPPKDATPDRNSPLADPARILQQQRIDALRLKHEQAKKEREKEMWRNASKPPRAVGKTADPSAPPEKPLTESQKVQGSLLSKLKQGKFFS